MSFRQLFIELNELSEWLGAGYRKRMRRFRLGERQYVQELCLNYDADKLLAQRIRDTRFVVLDTETTGFEAYAGDELVEIALLEYRGLRPTGRQLHSRINPGIPIPPESTDIHGIRDQDVEKAPSIEAIMDDVVEFMDDAVLVGHHVAFDLRFLNRATLKALDCRLPNLFVDTMVLCLAWSGQLDQYSLEEVAAACHVTIRNRHTAHGDAAACGAIFSRIAAQMLPAGATVADLMAIDSPPPAYGPGFLGEERSSQSGNNKPDNRG